MKTIGVLLLAAVFGHSTLQQPVLFRFEDNSWINLHHFLYVLGRAKASTPDSQRRAVIAAPREDAAASLSPDERRIWENAISYYERTLSKQDAVFDDSLVSLTNSLTRSSGNRSLDTTLSAELRSTLESVAPIYRKHWY